METQKYVLGISAFFHDSAAALVKGRSIVSAAQEERFTRKKGDWEFPVQSIQYCLEQLPPGKELDAVAFYENPLLKMDRIFRNAIRHAPRGAQIWPQSLRTLDTLNTELPKRLRKIVDDPTIIYFTEHHRSHAASAFYPAPYENSAILVVDGVGEWSTTSIWVGDRDMLTPISEIRFPNSLGLFYSAFTQYCGFKVNSGEYKLMGLAPFGRPVYRQKILNEIIDVKADGSFALNLKYFEFHTGVSTISPLFGNLFGQPSRLPSEPITQYFMDVAASAQMVINEIMQLLAAWTLKVTGMRYLCLAGGVALNCVANRKVLRQTLDLDGLWIQPASGDSGGALGAALDTALQISDLVPNGVSSAAKIQDGMQGAYLGPAYTQDNIKSVLVKNKLIYERYRDEETLCRITVDSLQNGDILGHFDGRMEFGPRALGNRSILADPRPKGMMSRVNLRIKFREGWRPFAPIILADQAKKYFDGVTDSPYMLIISDLKQQFRTGRTLKEARGAGAWNLSELQQAVTTEFTAISHVDYSSRLQTVDEHCGSRVYRILKAFWVSTDCPMLLNTSFNVRGEPIVCSPTDAINCFLNSHIDLLVIGQFIVRKKVQARWIQNKAGRTKFNAD